MGFVIKHEHHVIDAGSASQQTIALPSAEAKSYASGRPSASLLLMANVLREMDMLKSVPLNLMDSDAGRASFTRFGVGKLRHIQIRWSRLQERVRE